MNIKDFNKSKKHFENAIKNKSEVELIKYISIETWNRIGFVNNFGNSYDKIYEVTITQNIMFEISKFMLINKLNFIEIYESDKESLHGNDLLLCIEINKRFVKIPIQSKIINFKDDDGVYKSIFHSNRTNGVQIDLLDAYAKDVAKSNVALYLFYNYKKDFNQKDNSLYGCSFINTTNLRNIMAGKTKIDFNDLHPNPAEPFYKLFMKDDNDDKNGGNILPDNPNDDGNPYQYKLKKLYEKLGKNIEDKDLNKVFLYNKSEIISSEWKKASLSEFENTLKEVNENINLDVTCDSETFEPKYMIVLNYNDHFDSNPNGAEISVSDGTKETEIDIKEKEKVKEKRVEKEYEFELV